MRLTIFIILSLFTVPFSAFADAGPLVPVTKSKQPEFIKVEAARLQDGSTRFQIVLAPDGNFNPSSAYLQLKEGDRLRLTARLGLVQGIGNDEWRIEVSADNDFVRDGQVLISYGLTTGETVSKNWSVALMEFVPER